MNSSFSNINHETKALENLDIVSIIQKVLRSTDLKEYATDKVLSKYRKRHFKTRWTVTVLRHFDEVINLRGISDEQSEIMFEKYLSIRYGQKIGLCTDMWIQQVIDFKGRDYNVGDEVIPRIKIGAINLDREGKLSIRLDYMDKPGTITWRDIQGLNKWIKETKNK